MAYDALPFIDEHAVVVDVTPDRLWDAALETFTTSLGGTFGRAVAAALGCRPSTARRSPGVVGTTVPGFAVTSVDRPRVLVLEGRHRFARYAVALHVDDLGDSARCRLESRADFPGVHGRLYRLVVIGSRGHVVVVRWLLRMVAENARQA
ncbi:MAG TPA: hypothetical protein VNU26_02865 [Mycobacteriales bacterium]|nr:hypothetical protein [Mycobacteriales bacterium]